MNAEKRYEIFKRLSVAIPNPSTELEHSSTFELLIAVILSAQATDKGVNIATRRLFAVANTPEAIYALGLDGLESYIKTIGLYHAKAKNVLATCQQLITQHNSQVPNNRTALEALPGVGRKTANVILNTAFGEPTIAVDTHLFRLGNRIKLATGKTVLDVEMKYLKTIPKEFMTDAHHLLILHGRYTCTARNPKCSECCIADLCEYSDKNFTHTIDSATKKSARKKPLSFLPEVAKPLSFLSKKAKPLSSATDMTKKSKRTLKNTQLKVTP